jgi:hypothetical protein
MPSKHALMQAIEKAAAGVAEAAAAAEWCYQLRINEIQQELDHQLSSVRSASEAKLAEIDAAEKRDKEALAQAEAQHQRRLEAIQAELDEQLRAARADSARRAAEIQQGYEESRDLGCALGQHRMEFIPARTWASGCGAIRHSDDRRIVLDDRDSSAITIHGRRQLCN